MDKVFTFRKTNDPQKKGSDLLFADVFQKSIVFPERKWLFITPRDKDLIFGAGLLLQAAIAEGVKVKVLVVSDGSQAYKDIDSRDRMVDQRQKETREAYLSLGLGTDGITGLGYPDFNLHYFMGRSEADDDDIGVIENHLGLQNSFTYWIRNYKPNRIIVCNPVDMYPDHRVVHRETIISTYHAINDIWQELGEPIQEFPALMEYTCYAPFPEIPNIRIQGNLPSLRKKLNALKYYSEFSETETMHHIVSNNPITEYFREINTMVYHPGYYDSHFDIDPQ